MCFRFLFSCNDFSHAIGFMSWWMDYIKNRSAVQRYNTSQEQKHHFWGEEKAQGQMILKRKQNRSGIHKPIFFFYLVLFFLNSKLQNGVAGLNTPWTASGENQIFLWEQAVVNDKANSFLCRLDIHCRPYISLNADTININKKRKSSHLQITTHHTV